MARLGLVFSCLLACACARPALDELTSRDAGAAVNDDERDEGDERDEDNENPSQDDAPDDTEADEDAQTTGKTADAGASAQGGATKDGATKDAAVDSAAPSDATSGCADGDGDGVCDTDDNCPDLANRDQADRDGDGNGDACTSASVSCGDVALADEIAIEGGRVHTIRVAGAASKVANVAPGGELRFEARVAFGDCGMVGLPRQIYVGVEGSGASSCEAVFCPPIVPIEPRVELTLRAPREPGLHYIELSVGQQLVCGSSQGAATRVAALCVTP